MKEAKPFCISKNEVLGAYERVKANKGAAGVDGQSLEDFGKRLKKNLYKIWNRMSSGSYFPPPVKTVMIPKKNGGERKLGIPSVADRIAQQVVKARLEPVLDPMFHDDSYGYRPGKSALDAVGQARQRCWRYDWVVDLDIRGFFDNLDQNLLLRAAQKHAPEPWMVLYIERWLKAPMQEEDGRLVPREKGTPQGGVITPLTQKVIWVFWLRAAVLRGTRRDGNAVPNGDGIFPHQNVFNQQPYDSLALSDSKRFSSAAQAGKECCEGLCQAQECSSIVGLVGDCLQLRTECLLALT